MAGEILTTCEKDGSGYHIYVCDKCYNKYFKNAYQYPNKNKVWKLENKEVWEGVGCGVLKDYKECKRCGIIRGDFCRTISTKLIRLEKNHVVRIEKKFLKEKSDKVR